MSNLIGVHAGITTQCLTAFIRPHGLLLLLPDPITCFKSSSYSQTQTFRLEDPHASLVVLDWFTSGRMAAGEEWDFQRYRSVNEVWMGKRRVARDIMLLEQPTMSTSTPLLPLPNRPLKERLRPYACYATLILFGPHVQPCITSLFKAYDSLSQMQLSQPDDLIWSLTPLDGRGDDGKATKEGGGAVVRVAGKGTELVRNWLKDALRDMAETIGADAYNTAFVG